MSARFGSNIHFALVFIIFVLGVFAIDYGEIGAWPFLGPGFCVLLSWIRELQGTVRDLQEQVKHLQES